MYTIRECGIIVLFIQHLPATVSLHNGTTSIQHGIVDKIQASLLPPCGDNGQSECFSSDLLAEQNNTYLLYLIYESTGVYNENKVITI